jgi:hypothetical protein
MEHQEMLAEIARAFKFCKRLEFQHISDPCLSIPYSLQQNVVRADEKYLTFPDRACSRVFENFITAFKPSDMSHSMKYPFHVPKFCFSSSCRKLQSYLLRLQSLKAPSVYPNSNACSSSRTLYCVPSAQLCSPILTHTLSLILLLY